MLDSYFNTLVSSDQSGYEPCPPTTLDFVGMQAYTFNVPFYHQADIPLSARGVSLCLMSNNSKMADYTRRIEVYLYNSMSQYEEGSKKTSEYNLLYIYT